MEEARNPPRNGEGSQGDSGEAGIIFGGETEKDTNSRRTGKRKKPKVGNASTQITFF